MRLVASGVVAFLLGLALTLAVRAAALRLGMVAQPRPDRWHQRPTALLGGIAIYVAFLLTWLAFAPPIAAALPILVMATLMFAVGLVDDVRPLKPYVKLVLQLLAAVGTVAYGLRLPWTQYGPVNDVITIFWLVGISNAINLLDNMDGLAGGIAAIACGFLAVNLVLNDQIAQAYVPIALAGAVIGFLVFNVTPATIFMGDSGALFLGFLLAGTALLSEYGRSRSVLAVLFTPVLILLLPIFDTALVTVTRKMRGQPISVGGRDHTSHRLVALGITERQAVTRLYVFAMLSGGLALAVRFLGTEVGLLLIPIFGIGVLFLGLYLGKVRVVAGEPPAEGTVIRVLTDFHYKRRVFEVLLDLVIVVLAYYGAYLLRFDGTLPPEQLSIFVATLPLAIAIELTCFLAGGLYRGLWRYISVNDALIIGKVVVIGAALTALGVFMLQGFRGPSRAVFVLNGVLLLLFLGGSRVSFRMLRVVMLGRTPQRPDGTPMLIYGAGDGGELLIRELINNGDLGYAPIGFIDDDSHKAGKVLHGFPVYDARRFEELRQRFGVNDVVISTRKVEQDRLDKLREMGARLRRLQIRVE